MVRREESSRPKLWARRSTSGCRRLDRTVLNLKAALNVLLAILKGKDKRRGVGNKGSDGLEKGLAVKSVRMRRNRGESIREKLDCLRHAGFSAAVVTLRESAINSTLRIDKQVKSRQQRALNVDVDVDVVRVVFVTLSKVHMALPVVHSHASIRGRKS